MTLAWRWKWLRTRSSPEALWGRQTQGLRWPCGHQYRQGGRLLWWWHTCRFPIPTTIRKTINHIVRITTVEKRDQVALLARLVDDSMKIRDIAIIGPISLSGISKELGGRFENTTYHLINMFPKFATYAPLMGTTSSYSFVVFSQTWSPSTSSCISKVTDPKSVCTPIPRESFSSESFGCGG